jgi:cell division protein FtsQ
MSEYNPNRHKRTTGVSPLSKIPNETFNLVASIFRSRDDECRGVFGRVMKKRIIWYFQARLVPIVKLCLLLLFFILLGNVLWTDYISKSEGFAIKDVEFLSNGIIQESTIWKMMGVEEPEISLLSFDIDAAEKKLMECPAISHVTLRKDFPDKLCVEVDARVPVLWLECPDLGIRAHDLENGLLVDSTGIIFPYMKGLTIDEKKLPVLLVNSIDSIPVDLKQPISSQMGAVKLVTYYQRKAKPDSPTILSISKVKEWAYLVNFSDGSMATFEANELVIENQVDKYLIVAPHAQDRARETNTKVDRINLIPEVNVPVNFRKNTDPIPVAEPVEE